MMLAAMLRGEVEDDAALLLRVAGGDASAFATIYDVHRSRLYRLAYGVLLHPEDAREAVQEAFSTPTSALSSGCSPRSVVARSRSTRAFAGRWTSASRTRRYRSSSTRSRRSSISPTTTMELALEVHCVGDDAGLTESPRLSLTANGLPLSDALASVARDAKLEGVDYRATARPNIEAKLQHVRLSTALAVLSDESGLLITVAKKRLVVTEAKP